MSRRKAKELPPAVQTLLAENSAMLTKAQTIDALGLPETAGPLWAAAAACEERLAPMLEGLGHEREAALHRISAASCFQKAGDLARAANHYRAALAGPLQPQTVQEVGQMLTACLVELTKSIQRI